MTRARNLELDLVEVDRDAKPPVCKIMNYSRERYKKQVREKERAKSKAAGSLKGGTCKEVRVSAKTELKDLKLKANSVRRLMERGYRVKCTVTGTEDQDLCGLLSQLSAMIEDIAFVEFGPNLETKQAHLVVRHIKFGTGKKGGGKKASKDKSTASPKKGDSPLGIGEESCDEESGTDNDEVEAPSLSVTAVSSSDYNASNLYASKDPNATGLNVRPVSQELENRYARSPKDDSAARNPVRFPSNRTEPLPQPHPNPSVPARDVSRQNRGSIPLPNGPQQIGRLPSDDMYQARGKIPFQTTQPNSRLSGPIGRREPPSNVGGPESKLTGFGIFSKKVEGNNPNSAHPSGPGVVPGNLNPTTPQSNGPQKSESTEKKFGIFSR